MTEQQPKTPRRRKPRAPGREEIEALNAGADINGFAPVTFAELVENNRCFKNAHTAPA